MITYPFLYERETIDPLLNVEGVYGGLRIRGKEVVLVGTYTVLKSLDVPVTETTEFWEEMTESRHLSGHKT